MEMAPVADDMPGAWSSSAGLLKLYPLEYMARKTPAFWWPEIIRIFFPGPRVPGCGTPTEMSTSTICADSAPRSWGTAIPRWMIMPLSRYGGAICCLVRRLKWWTWLNGFGTLSTVWTGQCSPRTVPMPPPWRFPWPGCTPANPIFLWPKVRITEQPIGAPAMTIPY